MNEPEIEIQSKRLKILSKEEIHNTELVNLFRFLFAF
jgi:hypothetical protein